MSNIGFLANCVRNVEALFKKCMTSTGVNPSKTDKAEYNNLIFRMEQLYKYGEIKDEKEYKKLMKRLKAADLNRVVELRAKAKKKCKQTTNTCIN